ncbi:MAG TPA: glycerol kinase GlpK [Verrucomicrobiae bacterium]|nr:glycerol kinase GlpK [Verrucomicrobiae bacterium]
MLLALDQSTSATKALVFSPQGEVLARASREHRQLYPQPGWVEHDPEEIWQNTLAVLREVVEQHRHPISFLSLTNQRETILIFDRKTSKPLHNALVWLDRRGDGICADLIRSGHESTVREKTGLKINTYFSASKLKWLIQEKPGLAQKLKTGEAVIGTIDTYLIHRLTHGKTFATDFTNASRTLLFNIAELRWDPELCNLFEVSSRALPEVRESAAQFGDTDLEGLLPNPIPIAGVMGDSQAALFAQRCFTPGTAKATFGTGTSVMLNVGSAFRLPEKGSVLALAWVLNGQATFALEGLINFSAATIEWLKNQMGLIRDASEVEALACSVPDNGGVHLVPAFAGLSAPYWSPDARAAILGMSAHTRREHIVRAALESIAYQLRDVLDMMSAEGHRVTRIAADGGPTRNQFLMQFSADITRAELAVAQTTELCAWGAALNGLLNQKICGSLQDLERIGNTHISYAPKLDSAQATALHHAWQQAVRRVI